MLTPLQAFHIFCRHIINFYDPLNYEEGLEFTDALEVRDALSDANTVPEFACLSGAATVNPGVWENWEILTEEVLKDEKLGKQDQNEILLTREQALKLMECFLEARYWNKNNEALLKEVINEISLILKEKDLKSTEVWKQWIDCIPEALEFKEVFDNDYYFRLEKMRQEFWERERAKN